MATVRQKLGTFGEDTIKKNFSCPKCKKSKTFKQLVANFKCADIICDFCGYLAQVKTNKVQDINVIPSRVLGAAWKPQKERMDAGIYFPLYLVLVKDTQFSVFYLPSDLQSEDMFIPRKPLSSTARRAGWQGFYFDGDKMASLMTRLR
tara:strand:- start:229 stop:672 length:444 start_codon:yes stop_codon:yes gene_type:complete